MKPCYLAEPWPAPRGVCHYCEREGELAFAAVYRRAEGDLTLRFCTDECWREWARRVERLPETTLTTGV